MGAIFSSSSSNWQATEKNILLTGASSGIGAEMARNFAREGANLVLMARNEESLRKIKEECLELGSPKVEYILCDLTDSRKIKRSMKQAVELFSQLDVIFLNAGRSQGCYFEEIQDASQIEYMLRLNVSGVITTLHYLMPSLRKSKQSRIVINSSVSGLIGVPYRTIYCASKHALTGFANALRIELLDAYGEDSPVISLINFPEVAGTALNAGRMDFGAERPPAEFDNSKALSLPTTCRQLMTVIAAGKRQWGEPTKISILLPLYGLIPNILDKVILKTVQKTHYRPDN